MSTIRVHSGCACASSFASSAMPSLLNGICSYMEQVKPRLGDALQPVASALLATRLQNTVRGVVYCNAF